MVVLVTGANGQLGQSLQFVAKIYPEIQFIFCGSRDLDITNIKQCKEVFSLYKPSHCINTAAYTSVDKAESEPEKAHLINVVGARNLAEVCNNYNTTLLHISTDFVFDGNSSIPYTEYDQPNPIGVYGRTKLEGEIEIKRNLEKYYIIRTSWVYSQFGSNFMKTILRLANERDTISVVDDQIGTPTNAVALATALIKMILCQSSRPAIGNYGTYNFSDEGQCNWFDFAQKIFESNNVAIKVLPIPTSHYPTPAKRPKYSVLDKSKIKHVFGISIETWEEGLAKIPK